MNFMNGSEKQYVPWYTEIISGLTFDPNEVLKMYRASVQSVVLISAFVLYFPDTCFEWKFSISLVGCG